MHHHKQSSSQPLSAWPVLLATGDLHSSWPARWRRLAARLHHKLYGMMEALRLHWTVLKQMIPCVRRLQHCNRTQHCNREHYQEIIHPETVDASASTACSLLTFTPHYCTGSHNSIFGSKKKQNKQTN